MDIKNEIAERLVGSSEVVKEKVIDILFQKELDRRTDACLKVIEKLAELDKQYSKENKPDVVTYNEDGSIDKSSYSKDKVDALRKLREQRTNLDNALKKALVDNDFSKVLELGK